MQADYNNFTSMNNVSITATASNPVDTIEIKLDSIEIFSSQSRDDVYFRITNFV